MTGQGKPTNTVSVKMLSTRAEFREAYLRTLDENETLKAEHEQERLCLQAEIDAADQRIRALKTERDSLIADVRSALHAIEHEGPRLAALRVMGEHDGLARDLEQTRVQLAGCGVAALGYIQEPAKHGDYGWSASYQDVLKLRLEHDGLADRLAKAEAELEQARPLLEAVMAEGELSIVGKTSPAAHRLILAALAYREKRAGKGK